MTGALDPDVSSVVHFLEEAIEETINNQTGVTNLTKPFFTCAALVRPSAWASLRYAYQLLCFEGFVCLLLRLDKMSKWTCKISDNDVI